MDDFNQIASTLSLTMGVAWASGINLYAALCTLGLLGATGNMALPPDLQVLSDPTVIIAAGAMYVVEFITDKVPGVDTGWDAVHTFIRIPAGALLAAGAVGEVSTPLAVAAGIVGGGLAAGSHATKAGSRIMINASPEPFTNWFASIGEDVAVIAGLWTALYHPFLFISLLAIFILFMIWLLPKTWKALKKVFEFFGRILGTSKEEAPSPPKPPDIELGTLTMEKGDPTQLVDKQ